jgi:nondiscriminating glutamyl-tRNA synthetase
MKPRVRFCIRPAGAQGDSLTLSQARTALYGWLYARREGGAFILRVSDGAAPSLCDELRWLGLDWDEGPEASDALSGVLPTAEGQSAPLLAQVIDDYEMAITHVFHDACQRPQTEQELALYRTLGWEPPQYIHLPVVAGAGPDGEPLATYRARGYLPLALVNCLARLGWTPRGKRELLSPEALVARFDLKRVSRSAAAFDLQQLSWFNRRALCALDAQEIAALLVPRWQRAYGAADCAEGTALTPIEWQQALALVLREELDNLDQAVEGAGFAFVDTVTPDEQAREVLAQPYAPEVLRAFVRELPAVEPFAYEPIDAWISALRQRFKAALGVVQGVRSRDVMYVLRAALTGRMDGPCLVEACQLLGRERCAQRARAWCGDALARTW